MRRRVALFSLVIALCAIAIAAWAQFHHSVPVIVRLELLHPPEELTDERREIVLEIVNRGTVDVQITGVTTSCACSIPGELSISRLRPGTVGKLSVQSSPPGYGKKTAEVRLATNRPELPQWSVLLTLRGAELLPPYVLFRRDEIELTTTSPNTDLRTTIQFDAIESPDEEAWAKELRCSASEVEIGQLRIVEVKTWTEKALQRTYQADCRFPSSGGNKLNLWTGEFHVETRTPSVRPTVPLRFIVRRESPIALRPEILSVSAGEVPQGGLQRTIRIWRRDGAVLHLEKLETSDPWLTVEEIPMSSEKMIAMVRVTISNPPAHPDGESISGSVTLRTNHPDSQVVTLLVRVSSRTTEP